MQRQKAVGFDTRYKELIGQTPIGSFSFHQEREGKMRIQQHPILGNSEGKNVVIYMDDQPLTAREGDTIAAALISNGIGTFRYTHKTGEPRGIFCGIGQCTDCVVIVDGQPNVRSCVTQVKEGMRIQTQQGRGQLGESL